MTQDLYPNYISKCRSTKRQQNIIPPYINYQNELKQFCTYAMTLHFQTADPHQLNSDPKTKLQPPRNMILKTNGKIPFILEQIKCRPTELERPTAATSRFSEFSKPQLWRHLTTISRNINILGVSKPILEPQFKSLIIITHIRFKHWNFEYIVFL